MRRALAFLTPLGGAAVPDRRTLSWFPLVGGAIGLAVGGVWWGAERLWPPAVAAALTIAADLALTGMLHIDGLVDSADGLLPQLPPERRLEVMAEPTVGAYGVAVVVVVLVLRFAALESMAPDVLLVAGAWCGSRTVMAVAARALPYARPGGGLATAMLGGDWRLVALYGLITTGVLGALADGRSTTIAVAAGMGGAASAVVLLGRRRVGGFTGDILGAAGVVGETVALAVAAAMVTGPLGAALGILADRLVGEPPTVVHPVALLGRALGGVERVLYADQRSRGVAHAAVGLGLGATAGGVVGSTAVATYLAVAGRALGDAAREVEGALAAGRLDHARSLLPTLVGRDPTHLDEKEVCRAVIESVAENTVDAVVAPGIWAAVLGAPGALGHRAVNTMDAMVGHRDTRYARYGWAAARLDDAMAWVPARVAAGLVVFCRPRAAGPVARVVRRDARRHPSPNSGVAEAAFAAALGLRLGGPSRYGHRVEVRPTLGDGRPPERCDIGPTVRLSRDVSLALAAMLATAGLAGRSRA